MIAISDLGHPDEKTVKGSVDEMRSYEGGKINCLILPESPTASLRISIASSSDMFSASSFFEH